MPNDTLFLTLNGEPFAETEPINDLNALILCSETTIIPPYSNGYIPCKMPIVKRKANLNKTCVFEPSYKHRSTYSMCNTYDGIVTITEEVVKSGTFKVVMTNRSNKHVKINNNQTLGMLRSCQNEQICSLHEIVTFEPIPQRGEREETKTETKDNSSKDDPDTKTKVVKRKADLYYVPIQNKKAGKMEYNTLPKNDFHTIQVNEAGPQQDYVSYKKPCLADAAIDKKTRLDLEELLQENHHAFATDERQIGTTPLIQMSIDTGDHPPIAKKPYALALKHHDWVKEEIDKLQEAGVIRESHTSWSAPIVVIPKQDGGKRLCVDFSAVNAITRTYVWPMPRGEDIFAKLGKAKFFTTLDLRLGYQHIALDPDAIKNTAFVTPLGKYEYLKVPFGLAYAPAYFQELMNKVLNGLNFTLAYLDDIIIFSETAKQHLKHIQIVLTRLKQAKLMLKKSKCSFFKQELHYFGHLLTTNGIKPQTEKVKAISEMKPPKNQKGVREFLGMVGYYRKFINRFADAARPMTKLVRKETKFDWSEDCQAGYEYLRSCLTKAPILKYPDPSKRYVVFTDASDQAAAAVLTQEYTNNEGQNTEMPVAYLSAQFSDTQFKWSTVVKEDYAIYYAIKKWRPYLEDAEILLKSDAKSLQKFLNGRTDNVKLDRWSLELQGRNIQVEHIAGHKNKAADCLSRLPFVTRRRNNNPLNDADLIAPAAQIEVSNTKEDDCCPLCEVELTDTKALQQTDKHCIRISNLMKDPKSRFHERESYGYDEEGLLYHLNRENGKEYKGTVVPKSLIKTVLSEMHDHFGHFGIGKTYSLIKRYYYWPKMIKHIQAHVDSCSLCRGEKMQADRYQLQTTEIPKRPFAKVAIDLIVELPVSHMGTKTS